MIIVNDYNSIDIKKIIGNGGVGVIPTDTLYGIISSAFSFSGIEEIYALKKRDNSKPLIVLISDFEDLKKFDIKLDDENLKIVKTLWPGKVSVILPVTSSKWDYLTRGTDSIAFRLPNDPLLRKFLKEVGPIVAPSANPEGLKPAENMEEILSYFGDTIDFIVDGGEVKGDPSSLVTIKEGKVILLRGRMQ